jgi:ketosteroid isomerase-like protein
VSEENVDLLRELFAALLPNLPMEGLEEYLSDDVLAEYFDPAVEWVPVAQGVLAGTEYRGYEGTRRFWTDFLSMWDECSVEPERLIDIGNGVAATIRLRARTHELEVDELWSALFDVRGGKIDRVQAFTSPRGAEEAARQQTAMPEEGLEPPTRGL